MIDDRLGPSIDFSWEAVDRLFPLDDASPAPDPALVDAFLRHPDVEHLVQVSTYKALNRRSVRIHDTGHAGDADFVNDCRLLVFELLTDRTARLSGRRIQRGLAAAVYFKFSDRVAKILESAEWNGSSGMSTVVRRRQALIVHSQRMYAELGREPSREELVESFNARIRSRRKDAERSGMIATVDDLRPQAPVEFDPGTSERELPPAADADELPMLGVHATVLTRAILDEAALAEDPDLRIVADAWLGHILETPPFVSTEDEIVAETGLPLTRVELLRDQVMLLARQVLAYKFDIRPDGDTADFDDHHARLDTA